MRSPPSREDRDRQREETRRRLYKAALEVFRRDGVATSRIEDVAERAGVSRAAFYFHFPSREDVLVLRLQEAQAQIVEDLAAEPPTDLASTLAGVASALARNWQEDRALLPDIAGLALRRIGASVSERETMPVWSLFADAMRQFAEAGELTSDLSPEALADFYLTSILAAMLSWCARPERPLVDVLRSANQLFLHGAAKGGRPIHRGGKP